MKRYRMWILLALLTAVFCLALPAGAEETVPVTGVQFAVKAVTVKVGETTEPVGYSVKPENATNKGVLWSSDDESIAAVSADGAVSGVKAGRTRIRLTAEDSSRGIKTAILNVEVVQPVGSVTLDLSEIKIGTGGKVRVNAQIAPEDATNKKLIWNTSDRNIAQVSANGDIVGRGTGTAVITCESADGGASASVQVTVFTPVKNLKLEKNQLTAFVGKKTKKINVQVIPEDAEYQDYTWSSSDESIATVNKKGVVTGIASGTVKITATSNEPVSGNQAPKSVTCQVRVVQPVEYISLSEKKSTNSKLYLNVTVLPDTAADTRVEWTTSNKKIATVSNGVVKIKKREGDVTITAKAKDGSGIYASCDIHVGFSGSILRIGNFEQRSGAYYWNASNFTGNGTLPEEPAPAAETEKDEESEEDEETEEVKSGKSPEQWFEEGLGAHLPKPVLQSGEEPQLDIVTNGDDALDIYIANPQKVDFEMYASLLTDFGFTVKRNNSQAFEARHPGGYTVHCSYTVNEAGFDLPGLPGPFYEAMEISCEAASAE